MKSERRGTIALRALLSLMSLTFMAQAQQMVAPAPPPGPVDQPTQSHKSPRWRLALQTEAAFGVTPGGFYNHLAGGHADYRFTDTLSAGMYVGYANLKASDGGRAHNVLSYLLLDYRALLSNDWSIPLRIASGYLPKNGPVLRLSAGISYRLSDDFELTLDLLVPTFWIVDNSTVVSFNAALEGAYLFE
jgi:hypothetical protein